MQYKQHFTPYGSNPVRPTKKMKRLQGYKHWYYYDNTSKRIISLLWFSNILVSIIPVSESQVLFGKQLIVK